MDREGRELVRSRDGTEDVSLGTESPESDVRTMVEEVDCGADGLRFVV